MFNDFVEEAKWNIALNKDDLMYDGRRYVWYVKGDKIEKARSSNN